MANKIVDPVTPGEWQEAVDGAEWCLHIDSAVQYGLLEVTNGLTSVKTGPFSKPSKKDSGVNVQRCLWIIEEGKKRGIVPRDIKILTEEFKQFNSRQR